MDDTDAEQGKSLDFKVRTRMSGDAFGTYSNFAQVRSTEHDFVIDFAQVLPPTEPSEVEAIRASGEVILSTRARVVLPVSVVPGLIAALQDHWRVYLSRHSETSSEK